MKEFVLLFMVLYKYAIMELIYWYKSCMIFGGRMEKILIILRLCFWIIVF